MPRRPGHADDGRDWFRYLSEISRIFVISASTFGTVVAVVLLVLVILTLVGVA